MFSLFGSFLKDCQFVFKNFLHWNISKALLGISAYLITFLSLIPFALLLLIISVVNGGGIEGNLTILANIFTPLSAHFLNFSFSIALMMLVIFLGGLVIVVGILYSRVLFAQLNLLYIDKKCLGYTENQYFNFKLYGKYVLSSLLNMVIMFSPIVLCIIIFFLGVLFLGGNDTSALLSVTENSMIRYIFSGVLFLSSLITVYLGYRLSFFHLILVENPNYPVKKVISQSFLLTKQIKNLGKFIMYILPLGLILIIWNALGNGIDIHTDDAKNYINYAEEAQEVKEEDFLYHQELQGRFGKMTEEELHSEYLTYGWLQIFFFVINFLLVYGLFELLITGFYVRALKKSAE